MFKEGDFVVTTDEVAKSLQNKMGIIYRVYTKTYPDGESVQIYRMKIFGEEHDGTGVFDQEGCFDWARESFIRKATKLELALR